MDERDAQENFESSIEEFKAKLAAAQDALIVLQDQLEQSKPNSFVPMVIFSNALNSDNFAQP